jgi:uncharacterized OB-fold protein
MSDLPGPVPNADGAPYWEGAKAGRLMLQRCTGCAAPRFPPRWVCPRCGSQQVEWVAAAGRGTVYSFTIVHRAPLPAFRPSLPYVIALIDLEEGVRMMANIRGEDALEVAIGDAVEVLFEARAEGGAVPQFRRSRPASP